MNKTSLKCSAWKDSRLKFWCKGKVWQFFSLQKNVDLKKIKAEKNYWSQKNINKKIQSKEIVGQKRFGPNKIAIIKKVDDFELTF